MKRKFGKNIYIFLATFLIVVFSFFLFLSGDYLIFSDFFKIIASAWWIIFPIPAWIIFKLVWLEYREIEWAVKQKPIYLEIRVPDDVEKSPKTMEQVFAGLHTWSTPNKFEVYCGWRPLQDKFGAELISLGGEIHFIMRCPELARDNLESQIYAQYPDAEIFEVEDYTKNFPKNLPNKDYDVWGTALELVNDDALPIRTYKHFKEDVTGKMIDPLASLTEVMSKLPPDQNICFQIRFSPLNEPLWHPQSKKRAEEIAGKASSDGEKSHLDNLVIGMGEVGKNVFGAFLGKEPEFSKKDEEEKMEFNINHLMPGEQDQVRAIEENISKVGFVTTIRFIYFGKREKFNKALGVAGVMGAMKQFNDVNLNSFKPNNKTKTFANYFMTEARMNYRKRKIVQNYKDRDDAGCYFVFNTEELASIYHFPDMSVRAPAIPRIEAKKGEAPSNLPISNEIAFE